MGLYVMGQNPPLRQVLILQHGSSWFHLFLILILTVVNQLGPWDVRSVRLKPLVVQPAMNDNSVLRELILQGLVILVLAAMLDTSVTMAFSHHAV